MKNSQKIPEEAYFGGSSGIFWGFFIVQFEMMGTRPGELLEWNP
jgi:hypothetical protein